MEKTEIVPNMTLSQAVSLYNEAVEQIALAFASIVDAESKLALFGEHNSVYFATGGRCPNFAHPAEVAAKVEKQVWANIVDRMGIRGVMSIAARDKLDKQLEKGDMPELTEETVLGMMRGMHASLPSLAEEAIREVWDWLRPPERFQSYKSNPRFELQNCVKLEGVLDVSMAKHCRRYWVSHWHQSRLDALERVFRVLDGQGAAQRGYQSDLVRAMGATEFVSGAECETPYFRVKLFKKGAAHVYFKRLDLVAEFNRVCGGMNLRGERAA